MLRTMVVAVTKNKGIGVSRPFVVDTVGVMLVCEMEDAVQEYFESEDPRREINLERLRVSEARCVGDTEMNSSLLDQGP